MSSQNIFRVYRKLTDRSQREVASTLGRTQAWLSSVERGVQRPSAADAKRLAAELGVPRGAFKSRAHK